MLSNNDPRYDRANSLRILALEAIEKAQSGHGGMVLGMAEIATTLWTDHLVMSPEHPDWINRDRFILSNGHGSMLLYSLLHFTGFDLSMDDIKQFRQLHSKTPGHPESHMTQGVEVTTGPLGQGLAMAVGVAISERVMAAKFNTTHDVIDHNTWVFCGDGCLMEGISYEACSLAGTLKLSKLILMYDNNEITIDGKASQSFTEDVRKRFESMNWDVLDVEDGHSFESIEEALAKVHGDRDKPLLINCKTVIGKGLPHQEGNASAHANPVGADNIAKLRADSNLPGDAFEFEQKIYDGWQQRTHKNAYAQWQHLFTQWEQQNPKLSGQLNAISAGKNGGFDEQGLADIQGVIQAHIIKQDGVATRKSFGNILNEILHLPNLMIGSADLGGSTGTLSSNSIPIGPNNSSDNKFAGNYIHFGVREFGMCAVANGMSVSGLRPVVGTFLSFSDYARPAVRMAGIMQTPSLFIFTHDTVALGEDGPTHQPIEHLASLRAIPQLQVWRPADTAETAGALSTILRNNKPACLILSRQNLPAISHRAFENSDDALAKTAEGGYILFDSDTDQSAAKLNLFACGSELSLACEVAEDLKHAGIQIRVISTLCHEALAQAQPKWLTRIVNDDAVNVGLEAGSDYAFNNNTFKLKHIIGIQQFGASAPGDQAMDYFGFSAEKLTERILQLL